MKGKMEELYYHSYLLTNGVCVLAFSFLGPQFEVDGTAAHS